MAITALPTPPSRADSPGDFSSKADALLGALPTFVSEANALQSDVNTKYNAAMAAGLSDAAANAQSADASEAAALAAKIQAEYARDQAIAGLGAADNSQALVTLSEQLAHVQDIAGLAVRNFTDLEVEQSLVKMAHEINHLIDLAGIAGRSVTERAKLVAAPATASSAGTKGEVAYDTGFFYVCTANNTWKRVALSSW